MLKSLLSILKQIKYLLKKQNNRKKKSRENLLASESISWEAMTCRAKMR